MKLYIINGPNLNMLGIREPDIYGKEDYDHLVGMIREYAAKKNIEAECFQSNHEGALVDKIQEAYFKGADGIVINPGGYTHTSIAIMDAVKSVMLPAVEVHISNLANREEFRHISYIRRACIDSVIGEGLKGYLHAMDILEGYINDHKD
jgi:3-dehydroquinate dehydratase type II